MGIHQSKKHVVAVETPSGTKKIFSVGYSEKDGSVFIHLPYLKRDGLIGIVSGIPNGNGTLSVQEFHSVGKTNHGIKFSYHPDGRTHFSLERKIFTALPHNGVPLSEKTGPICYITAHGLSGFEAIRRRDLEKDHAKKGIWALTSPTELPGVEFIVLLKPDKEVRAHNSQETSNSIGMVATPDGSMHFPAISIGQLCMDKRHDRVMVVAYRPLNHTSTLSKSCLLFRGPYVELQEASSAQGKLFAQSVVYPADLAGDLLESIPSVDRPS